MSEADEAARPLPAWSLPAGSIDRIRLTFEWPDRVTREWALEGATGKDVRVCVLDSGVEADHPKVGSISVYGNVKRTFDTGSYPFGITAGPDGNMWFCVGFGNAIGRVRLG